MPRKGCLQAGGGGSYFQKGERVGFSPLGSFETLAFSCSFITAQPLGTLSERTPFLLHQNHPLTSSNCGQEQTCPGPSASCSTRAPSYHATERMQTRAAELEPDV